MNGMLETPSRVWRRIQDVDGLDMPSLPSLPAFDETGDPHTETDSTDDMDLSDISNPVTSTPAAFSSHTNTMSTIKAPLSAVSTARFAHSLTSRSTKSGLSNSRASISRQGSMPPKEYSFEISAIPALPNPRDEMDLRSSDQDTSGRDSSTGEPRLPSMNPDMTGGDDLDLSDALQSISRSGSPVLDPEPTPRKKPYDYSVSLRSEPKASPFDKLRHVSIRRPLSRNTRTPSLTRTNTPSPSSSSSHSTPQSVYSSFQQARSQTASPLPALAIPLPRSPTASPAPVPRVTSASPMPARYVPLPPSANNSPVTTYSPRMPTQPDSTDHGDTVDQPSLPPEPSDAPYAYETTEDTHEATQREPTFTSEEGSSPSTHTGEEDESGLSKHLAFAAPPATTFSSPTPSALMTPTPAIPPRPRPRFNLHPQSTTVLPNDSHDDDEHDQRTWRAEQPDLATPHTHKRSFLLSVINSTARPRLRHNPIRNGGVPATPGVDLQSAFAGVTPGPGFAAQRRLSHPLAQAWTAQSDSGSGSESAAGPHSPGGYDGAVDRASFLSTTSSQDLALHVRANASFDPLMGLAERGHGVGRFNAGKLNNYLHGLNRKLQEENETLVAQLRAYEEQLTRLQSEPSTSGYDVPTQSYRSDRRASGGRRVSAGPLGLNAVVEDVAEVWIEEKAELEDMLDDMREQLETANIDKAQALQAREYAERALADEKTERSRDKDKWREKMGEVEKGVEEIVDDLYRKLRNAEDRAQAAENERLRTLKETERRLAEVVVERDVLAERMEKAEDALQDGQDLGGAVNAANERAGTMHSELKNANLHIKGLEEDVAHADERLDTLEQELREERKLVAELEEELQLKSDELSETLQRIGALEGSLNSARDELEQEKAAAAELEHAGDAAVDRIEALEDQLAATQNKMQTLMAVLDQERERASRLEVDAERASELAKQTEEALDAAEAKMQDDESTIASLKAKLASLERELDRSRVEPSQAGMDPDAQEEMAALEAELDDAHKEIARLNVIVSQSPARKAIEKAKDARIGMLEQEREDLLERLKSLKTNSLSTPGKMLGTSSLSPMHRHLLSMSFKSPKTPGGPLRDMSWLQSPMNEVTAAPLVAEIERLQFELQQANESIDEKLDRLEDAGFGVVSLTNQLEDAKAKIITLEDEVARLGRKEERRAQRLEKLRCQKCHTKVNAHALQHPGPGDESSFVDPRDFSLPSEPPTPPSKTSDRLRADLQSVNAQLASMKQQWDAEKRKLLGENATLKDATNRLHAEVRQAKNEIRRYTEADRGKAGSEGELDRARRMVEELEAQLKAERSRLRGLTTEQSQAERQKEEVTLQLRRTESDMADVREELQRIKLENHELEAEMRANTNVEQKARLLEAKVAENTDTIEQLRRERSLLVAAHKQLQKRHSEVSQNVSKLREQHAKSQTSHNQRRHQLDLQLLEIEDLRRALSTQADELHRAEDEKNRATSEKSDMAQTVAALEADLRRVKRDAEAFGRDLKQLRSQKERVEADRKEEASKAERAQKQAQTQIRLLKEEAREERETTRALREELASHACVGNSASSDVLAARHKRECKGLVVQIRYLKAKWVRENTLRADLGYQKQYLLVLLSRSERKEEKILAAIAQIGFQTPANAMRPLPRRRPTLKHVALSVVFVLRARRAGVAWREHREAKGAIAEALEDVRRSRPDKGKQRATS